MKNLTNILAIIDLVIVVLIWADDAEEVCNVGFKYIGS